MNLGCSFSKVLKYLGAIAFIFLFFQTTLYFVIFLNGAIMMKYKDIKNVETAEKISLQFADQYNNDLTTPKWKREDNISITKNYGDDKPEKYISPNISPVIISKCKFDNSSIEAFDIDLTEITISDLDNKYPMVQKGGLFKPLNCTPHSAVAIVVPYRNRAPQLPIFLNNMHRFLQKQQLEYGIYIVEQSDDNPFNRGMLMNVGYLEALKYKSNYDCFIFHDVDLIPEINQNFYGCDPSPRHYCAGRSNTDYKLLYKTFFGGVSSLTTDQFKTINGFSNLFWGWGGEDDDLYNRVVFHNFTVVRYPSNIGRYLMLSHQTAKPNPERIHILHEGETKFNIDGLNNIVYNLTSITQNALYTNISVEFKKL